MGVDRSGRVRFLNASMRALFSVEGEVESVPFYDVFPVNDFTRSLSNFVKDSNPTPIEQVLVLDADQVFLCQIWPVMSEDNRFQGVVASLKNMAAVQKLERGIDQALADLNRELRLPLTTIKGYVETLLEGAYQSDEVTRKFLQIINEETNRLARLVMSLEEASGAGQTPAAAEPTELIPILQQVAQMFESVAAQKNLSLQLKIEGEIPSLELEPNSFSKAVVNLVDNAVKCTGLSGYGTVTVECQSLGDKVRVAVRDSGPGIASDEQDQIFEAFYRVQQGPQSELGGTGLGLSVAKEAVEKAGGTLSVTSAPGQGATFEILLPV